MNNKPSETNAFPKIRKRAGRHGEQTRHTSSETKPPWPLRQSAIDHFSDWLASWRQEMELHWEEEGGP